jgi:hypothetical protein
MGMGKRKRSSFGTMGKRDILYDVYPRLRAGDKDIEVLVTEIRLLRKMIRQLFANSPYTPAYETTKNKLERLLPVKMWPKSVVAEIRRKKPLFIPGPVLPPMPKY